MADDVPLLLKRKRFPVKDVDEGESSDQEESYQEEIDEKGQKADLTPARDYGLDASPPKRKLYASEYPDDEITSLRQELFRVRAEHEAQILAMQRELEALRQQTLAAQQGKDAATRAKDEALRERDEALEEVRHMTDDLQRLRDEDRIRREAQPSPPPPPNIIQRSPKIRDVFSSQVVWPSTAAPSTTVHKPVARLFVGPTESRPPITPAGGGSGEGDHTVPFSLLRDVTLHAIVGKPLNESEARIIALAEALSSNSAHVEKIKQTVKDYRAEMHAQGFFVDDAERKKAASFLHGSAMTGDLLEKTRTSLKHHQLGLEMGLVSKLAETLTEIQSEFPGASYYTKRNPDKGSHARNEGSALRDLGIMSAYCEFLRSSNHDKASFDKFCAEAAEVAQIYYPATGEEGTAIKKHINRITRGLVNNSNDPTFDMDKSFKTDNPEFKKQAAGAINQLFDFGYYDNPSASARVEDLKMLPQLTARLLATAFHTFDFPIELRETIAMEVCQNIMKQKVASADKYCQGWGACSIDAASGDKLTATMLLDVVKEHYLEMPAAKVKDLTPIKDKTFAQIVEDRKTKTAVPSASKS